MNIEKYVCRNCQSAATETILKLGEMPLANSLVDFYALECLEETYKLDLVFCASCCLVQITETVPPEKLFTNYLYLSSISDTVLEHSKQLTERLIKERTLTEQSTVIEIASNDGYLLQFYKQAGIPVLGIEPAKNIAEIARRKGIDTLDNFFDQALADRIVEDGFKADVIHANNVLAHVADLSGFVKGIEKILKDTGIAVIEVPYVERLISNTEFDTIYHEHLCYFSLLALQNIFKRHGLIATHVEEIAIHGGSLRVFVEKEGANCDQTIKNLLKVEMEKGIDKLDYYLEFGRNVSKLKQCLLEMLSRLKSEGKSISAYGASAKGSTLMNYMGIDSKFIDVVYDRSTVKQGLYTPGNHLPILEPEVILEKRPDYLLLLTWNFADEILKQQKEYRRLGGKFIVPVPEPHII